MAPPRIAILRTSFATATGLFWIVALWVTTSLPAGKTDATMVFLWTSSPTTVVEYFIAGISCSVWIGSPRSNPRYTELGDTGSFILSSAHLASLLLRGAPRNRRGTPLR